MLFRSVQDAKTAREARDNSAAVYENPGAANKMYLQEKLMTAKLEEEKSVKAHIEEMRRIVSQLAGLGVKTTEDEYKLAILRSLPSNYESLVVTLENLIDQLGIQDVHARLLREEARQKSSGEHSSQANKGSMFQAKQDKREVE